MLDHCIIYRWLFLSFFTDIYNKIIRVNLLETEQIGFVYNKGCSTVDSVPLSLTATNSMFLLLCVSAPFRSLFNFLSQINTQFPISLHEQSP